MKKSMKVLIIGLLAVPIMAFGSLAVSSIAAAYTAPVKDSTTGKYNEADCTDAMLDPRYAPMDFAAFCNNKAGGVTELFGKGGVITTVINFALYFIGAISVLMLIIGGVRYTMSGGNEKAVGAAKNTILYAVVGVVVALLAYAIVNFVLGTFSATA